MADRRQNNRRNSTPERVQQAAQAMNTPGSSGMQRGYVPQNTGGYRPAGYPNGQIRYPGPGSQPGGYSGQMPVYPNQGSMQYTSATGGGQRGFVMPPPAGNTAKRKKASGKKGKKALLAVLAMIVAAAALGAGIYLLTENNKKAEAARQERQRIANMESALSPYSNQYFHGVYVDGIELGGMTPEQAKNAVQSQIQQRSDAWNVTLTYQGSDVVSINASMLGMKADTDSVLNEAWEPGHFGTLAERYNTMLSLQTEPRHYYTAKPSGNNAVIDSILGQIKTQIDRPAEDAKMVQFDPSQDDPFVYQDEIYGLNLETEPLKNRLYQMVSSMESGTVDIVPEQVKPEVTRIDLQKHYMMLSYCTTPIDSHSPPNRNSNIRVAFSRISGYVLQPGKTFSFNKLVGERSVGNGFLTAVEYVYGEHVEGVGGGVCQASTTVYQAAVKAGLKITKRYHHSDSVSYTDYGKDATVSDTKGHEKDLKFVNTTDYPIYFVAAVLPDPANKKREICKVTLYGEDMGDVWYDLESELIETLPAPFEPKYIKDKNREYVTYTDEQKSVSKAQEGYIYKSYRVKYVANIYSGREELFTDRYEPKPEKIYVGVTNRE